MAASVLRGSRRLSTRLRVCRDPFLRRLSPHLARRPLRARSTAAASDVETGPALSPRPSQTTDTVFMVAPRYFNLNPATAADNVYQCLPGHLAGASGEEIAELAVEEFDSLVALLRGSGVRVMVTEPGEAQRECSDAVFPNNWVSFHEGRIVVYPMKVESRRRERRMDVVERLCRDLRAELVDYTGWEREGKFLEGTGSMVLDRVNRICYACLSQRTHPEPLAQFCRDFDYKPVTFSASQDSRGGALMPVYHTNVICCVGDTFAVLCTAVIRDGRERRRVVDVMESTGKEVVEIEESQVYQFAGNCLQVHSSAGERLLVMSTAAYRSYRSDQLWALRRHVDRILHVPLPTIETLGGGGARCMQTEVFSS
jgi:hypothetical protein